jgi:hypothetical protein
MEKVRTPALPGDYVTISLLSTLNCSPPLSSALLSSALLVIVWVCVCVQESMQE